MTVRVGRKAAAVAGVAAISLVLAACGSDDGGDATATDDAAAAGEEEGPTEGSAAEIPQELLDAFDCSVFDQFGDLDGTTVSVYTSITAPEDQAHVDSWVPFEECTGIDVVYEGTKEFEAQLVVRTQAGTPPDLAYFPQPGLLRTIVQDTGAVLPIPDEVAALVDENFDADWAAYADVDGTRYAAPLGANYKSLVWYSPAMFEEAGYELPETWEELIALSDQIVEDNPDGTVKPWCAGIESGAATGWPITDWTEDVMLRVAGPETYDAWVNNDIPFNDPIVVEALDRVGSILKNPDFVNGGIGDVRTIASTAFQQGGLPILDGNCYMHRQASFYQSNFADSGVEAFGPEGEVDAFYFPADEGADLAPNLLAGEFTAAFADRPEVVATQYFLASTDWANFKAAVSPPGWASPNLNMDPTLFESSIDVFAQERILDPEAVSRFDGADNMPAAVGSGSFWSEATEWIASDKSTEDVLDAIEASWPS